MPKKVVAASFDAAEWGGEGDVGAYWVPLLVVLVRFGERRGAWDGVRREPHFGAGYQSVFAHEFWSDGRAGR